MGGTLGAPCECSMTHSVQGDPVRSGPERFEWGRALEDSIL